MPRIFIATLVALIVGGPARRSVSPATACIYWESTRNPESIALSAKLAKTGQITGGGAHADPERERREIRL